MRRARSSASCASRGTTRTASSRSACSRPTSRLPTSSRRTSSPRSTACTRDRRRRSLKRIKGKPYTDMLQTVMLRSLQQAVYTPENVGHFGLAYDAYAHFTSPIRRYPDLLVHRGIKAVIAKKKYDAGDLNAIGQHCSETERRADDATRDVEAWLKTFYMQDRVGYEFDGTISGVTHFGLFVTLDELYVDGLIHISDLGQDYFQFD